MSDGPVISQKKYFQILFMLLSLLGASYLLAHIDLGPFSTAMGLFIAAMKAILVMIYFMHLRFSKGIYRVVAGAGVFWLGILMVLAMSDYLSRNWLSTPGFWPDSNSLVKPNNR
jgi:cytochrome c oxidase subunit 4